MAFFDLPTDPTRKAPAKKKAAPKKAPPEKAAPKRKVARKLPVSKGKAPSCKVPEGPPEPVEATGRLKVKPKSKRKRSASCKRPAPKVGKKPSDMLWPECESSLDQRKLWTQGRIPSFYPEGGYEPGRQPKHGHDWKAKSLTPTGLKYGVPASYKDPDLRWFIDPRVAGDKAGKIVVFFSGGKDSLACLLYVIETVIGLGLNPSETIECIHHCVDGRPWFYGGSGINEFDWPCTEDYCRAICACLGIPLLFNFREGGLMGEVLKGGEGDPLVGQWEKSTGVGPRPTARMFLEMPPGDGNFHVSGGIGEDRSRRSFPPLGPVQKGGRTYRWCSAVVKIDLGRSHISNRKDLYGKRILAVSGERADESKAREHYLTREFETGHASRGRHVERWRPIHKWCEIDVWALIFRWRIRPHPAYQLGWGRLSCMTCIFGSPSMWASIAEIDPGRFDRFAQVEEMLAEEKQVEIKRVERAYKRGSLSKDQYEKDLKSARGRIVHIKGQNKPLGTVVAKAEPYKTIFTKAGQRLVRIALSHRYTEDPIMNPWRLPPGAFGEASGPI